MKDEEPDEYKPGQSVIADSAAGAVVSGYLGSKIGKASATLTGLGIGGVLGHSINDTIQFSETSGEIAYAATQGLHPDLAEPARGAAQTGTYLVAVSYPAIKSADYTVKSEPIMKVSGAIGAVPAALAGGTTALTLSSAKKGLSEVKRLLNGEKEELTEDF